MGMSLPETTPRRAAGFPPAAAAAAAAALGVEPGGSNADQTTCTWRSATHQQARH